LGSEAHSEELSLTCAAAIITWLEAGISYITDMEAEMVRINQEAKTKKELIVAKLTPDRNK